MVSSGPDLRRHSHLGRLVVVWIHRTLMSKHTRNKEVRQSKYNKDCDSEQNYNQQEVWTLRRDSPVFWTFDLIHTLFRCQLR